MVATFQFTGNGVAVPVVVASTVIWEERVAAANRSGAAGVGVIHTTVQVAVGVGGMVWVGRGVAVAVGRGVWLALTVTVALTCAVSVTVAAPVSVISTVVVTVADDWVAPWAYNGPVRSEG